MMRSTLVPAFAFSLVAVACGSSDVPEVAAAGPVPSPSAMAGTPDAGAVSPPKDSGTPLPSPDAAPPVAAPVKVFTVMMENHDYSEVVGSPDAPFFNELIASYGLATNYSDCNIHPSLPNYLCMVSGEPQYPGILDVGPNSFFGTGKFPVDKPNLGTQLVAAGLPWGAYQESMGTPCKLTDSSPYATKHDPFLYFKDMQTGPGGLCAANNVDYTNFAADLAAGSKRFSFITPNLTNDGHDPASNPVLGLKTSDAWARTEVGKIMASDAYKNGGVIFITWDEAEGRSGRSKDQIPMIIVSERIKSPGYKSAKAYSHKSYLATVEDLLGLPRLATVATEPSMLEFLK
jgi:phosphatidylinositol-3-phosphatase